MSMEGPLLGFPTRDLIHEDPQCGIKTMRRKVVSTKRFIKGQYTQNGVGKSGVGNCPEATSFFPF